MPPSSTEVPPQTSQNPEDSQPEVTNTDPVKVVDEPFTVESSQLKATREQHKKSVTKGLRGSGVKGNTEGMSSVLVKPEIPLPIPTPRFTVFRSGAANNAQDSRRAYAYWNELPTWAQDRTVLYVYRDWPKLVEIEENSGDFVYIDKIIGSEPLQDDVDLLNRYGAGSYKLMLNETHPTGRNLCTIWVTNLGVNDLKSHPPVDKRISDIKNVDMDFPGNKSYIEFLRMAGKLPEQTRGKELEAELANVALVDKLMDRNDKLQDTALDIARKAADKPTAAPKEISDEAINRAINIVATGAERANKMITEAAEAGKEARKSEAGSVKETLDIVSTIIDKFAPGRGEPDPEVALLRAELERMRSDRFKSLEDQINSMKSAPANSNTSPSATMKESITAFKEMRDLVEDVVGNGKSNPVVEAADELGMPKWLQLSLQYGLPVINNVLGLVMAGRGLTPMPNPAPPTGMPGMPNMSGMGGPGGVPMPPMAPRPNPSPGMAPTAGLPAPVQTVQQPQTELTQNGVPTYGLHPDIADILFEQKTPIVQYLAAGDATGEDYAELFANTYGLPVFNMMAGFGKDALLLAITSFPPIMSRLGVLSVSSDRLAQFAGEFCDFKPELEPLDDGEEESNNGKPGPGQGTDGSGAA
jgi:hypothetical protein